MSQTTSNPLIIHPPADLVQSRPDLLSLSKQLSLQYVHQSVVAEDSLKAIGQQLWQVLAIDADFARAQKQAGLAVLPVIIVCGSPEVFSLPWECLYHPTEGFLAQKSHYALSRRWLNDVAVDGQKLCQGPLRVLLFSSLPDGVGRLDVEREEANVLEALDDYIHAGQVILDAPNDGRLATFAQKLRDETFHLVFLSGHGNFRTEAFAPGESQATFLFEHDDGSGDAVAMPEIATAFIGTQVRCVVLSACESGKIASDDLNTGLATGLIAAGLPHVIGMRESVFDQAGILFAQAFCRAIVHRERLDVAIQAGRAAITPASLGQWCLPLLVSRSANPLMIDWNFTAQPVKPPLLLVDSLTDIAEQVKQRGGQPQFMFIGRRKELRDLTQAVITGKANHWLVTGPGGQGKTTLVLQLARRLEKQGYCVHAYSARPEDSSWEQFLFQLKSRLGTALLEQVERLWGQCPDESTRAKLLLSALVQASGERLVLFFDNLESIQDKEGAITEPVVAVWLEVALRLAKPVVLLTSRWHWPAWRGQRHILQRPSYGDFLRYIQQVGLEAGAHKQQLYEALGGNFKGLQLFSNVPDKPRFLERLQQTQAELQAYMAVEWVVGFLEAEALALLQRLPIYRSAVLEAGVLAIAGGLAEPIPSLRRLVNLALVDVEIAYHWNGLLVYQISPLVAEWLQQQPGVEKPALELRRTAAVHQQWVFEHGGRRTLAQAMTVHEALLLGELQEQAERFALDRIVSRLVMAGMYRTVLDKWLPALRESKDDKVRGQALGWSGRMYDALGNYVTALDYYEQSLQISRKIGDRTGEGTTLNNISLIYDAKGDYDTALDYLQQSLQIYREIGDRAGEGTTLNNISTAYYVKGDYDTALDYLQQSLKIRREIGDRAGEGTTLNNISQIYKARGDYDTALDYLQQSLQIHREIGNRTGEGTTLNNLSQIYDAKGDYETALDYLQQSLQIRRQIGDRAGEGATLNNISQIYDAKGDYDTALDYLQQSLQIRRQIGDQAGLCPTLFNIAHIHWVKDDKQQAFAHWKQAYEIAKQIGYHKALSNLESTAKTLGGQGLDFWENPTIPD